MKTAKAGIEKSVWALVLGLGLVLAAQAQPADSTGAGRVISSQGTISSSSGTTGTYTPAPPQVIAPAPVYDANRAWTLSFVGETKCLPNDANYCFKINPDGTILRIGSGESCWGQSTVWPVASAPVPLLSYRLTTEWGGGRTYNYFSATAVPTISAQGVYSAWNVISDGNQWGAEMLSWLGYQNPYIAYAAGSCTDKFWWVGDINVP